MRQMISYLYYETTPIKYFVIVIIDNIYLLLNFSFIFIY